METLVADLLTRRIKALSARGSPFDLVGQCVLRLYPKPCHHASTCGWPPPLKCDQGLERAGRRRANGEQNTSLRSMARPGNVADRNVPVFQPEAASL